MESPSVNFEEVTPLPEEWKQSPTEALLPAGRYFVSDPCYPFSSVTSLWDAWLAEAQKDEEKYGDSLLSALVGGFPVVGVNTLYGDGSYEGSDGFYYSVDAGLIGVTAAEVIEGLGLPLEDSSSLGTWHTFAEPFTVKGSRSGRITIGDLTIETGL